VKAGTASLVILKKPQQPGGGLRHGYLMAAQPNKVFLCFLIVTMAARAGEYAVLSNGFRIHADSHVVDGSVVRLRTAQGVIEIPVAAVAGFEREDYVAPASPSPTAARQSSPDRPALTPQELTTRAAKDAGLPPAIVHSIAKAESGYRLDAVSPKGAVGLMQLMPATAAQLNADPHDPLQNAEAGADYLRDLLLKYENDPHQVSKAIAAYNAGPAAVDKYHGIPPYRETIEYVNRVLKEYEKEQHKKTSSDQ
jgi:soluble lytic murein transglycosylase-like protein